jgi:hypothetical protein
MNKEKLSEREPIELLETGMRMLVFYEYDAYICMPMMLIVRVVSLMMLGASWGWGFWTDDAQFGLVFFVDDARL